MAYIGRYVGTDKTTKTLKLDTIQSQFNGSQTVFSLRSDNVAVYPPVPQSLVISLNGVIQEPTTAYTVSADTITFSPAPATNTAFFGVLNGGQVDIGTFYAVGDATIAGRATFSNTVSVTGAVNALSTVGVTGTFSALGQLSVTGNATFDTSTLFVDATNDRVGIGTTVPDGILQTDGAGDQGVYFSHNDNVPNRTVSVWLGTSNDTYKNRSTYVRAIQGSGIDNYSLAFGTTLATDSSTQERMRITSAGNVGINTSSPDNYLHIENLSTVGVVGATQLTLEGRYNGYGAGINFVSRTSSAGTRVSMAKITADGDAAWNTTSSTQDASLRFHTTLAGSQSEKMRITTGGNLAIGATARIYLDGVAGTGDTYIWEESANTMRLVAGGSTRINLTSTATYITHNTTASAANAFLDSTFNEILRSTSSIRYKHDIKTLDANHAVSAVMAMRPVTYRGKEDADQRHHVGFIAEEMAEIAPLLCTYDEGGESGTPNYVTYDRVTAYLVAVVQQQQAKIAALEARLIKG